MSHASLPCRASWQARARRVGETLDREARFGARHALAARGLSLRGGRGDYLFSQIGSTPVSNPLVLFRFHALPPIFPIARRQSWVHQILQTSPSFSPTRVASPHHPAGNRIVCRTARHPRRTPCQHQPCGRCDVLSHPVLCLGLAPCGRLLQRGVGRASARSTRLPQFRTEHGPPSV
jgi:hypothetical protein